ncbi:MAG: hypothetical protein A3K19_29075 [Lentisphaerae bacterium RIFOXYB12_FULL_65_16]|nr:MAG: hypothetical protein A3K18_04465 [Lentisphaerae bacterium RIFOXYA12_64_32]OGV88351.1 MAG: hypothetical protein A3K19_29075 [Lentisphaerae bacterium RIFOXYB12_FULL_65_16]
MAYAWLATLILLVCPPLARTPFGDLSNAVLLPLIGVALASLAIPLPVGASPRAADTLGRIKVSAVLTLGLAPFVSWWLRADENLYLLLMAVVACYAVIWYLLELSSFLFELTRDDGPVQLRLEIRLAHSALFYLGLVPVLAVHVSFLIALVMVRGTVLSDLSRTWMIVPWPARYGMLLPVIYLITLLWRLSGVLASRGAAAGAETRSAALAGPSASDAGAGRAGEDAKMTKENP